MKIETRYGSMNVLDTEGDIVSRFLVRYGEWSEFETKFVAANLPAAARVADIGAFLGSFGIGLSQQVSLASVCFLEANPKIIPMLRENVAANCRAPSELIEALICPDELEIRGARRFGANEGSLSFDPNGKAEIADDALLPDRRLTLTELLRDHGPFDCLKLDIEGMELSVLREGKDELSKGDLSIWVECNETQGSLDVAEFFLECGLKLHYFAYPSFNPNNFRGEPDAIFPMAYEAGLFASRTVPTLPEYLLREGCLLEEITEREALRRALWRTPRWCPPEIVEERPENMLAVAIRYLSGQNYDHFLLESAEPGDMAAPRQIATLLSLNQSLSATELRLRETYAERDQLRLTIAESEIRIKTHESQQQQLVDEVSAKTAAIDRLSAECEADRAKHSKLTEWLEAIADDRLTLLHSERRLREQMEERIAHLTISQTLSEERAARLEKELLIIHGSRSWRLRARLLQPLARFPRIRTALRLAVRDPRALMRRLLRR
ncbi:MAG TPA: FkbM family methyltransferase [Bosea sp. (in: a-proteobacteria)]|uniref:FkbM family methyltransferase n=1 Tax=Bosea sp. (in: a-proteobacteria) TaxID=1871050 RepID=UPI002E0FA552|nr:FkbM family methyltransferase [Bosea sp. (in: a-proteobacteria)]